MLCYKSWELYFCVLQWWLPVKEGEMAHGKGHSQMYKYVQISRFDCFQQDYLFVVLLWMFHGVPKKSVIGITICFWHMVCIHHYFHVFSHFLHFVIIQSDIATILSCPFCPGVVESVIHVMFLWKRYRVVRKKCKHYYHLLSSYPCW